MPGLRPWTTAAELGAWILFWTVACRANDPFPGSAGTASTETSDQSLWVEWLDMVSHTQAEQPRWMTPLVTITPLLTQSFHYDILFERSPGGSPLHLINQGGPPARHCHTLRRPPRTPSRGARRPRKKP